MKQKKANPASEVSIAALEKTILDLHGCKATWVESVPIKEVFGEEMVWEGVVQVFDIQNHPTATRCYAWSHGLDDSKKRQFFAVLKIPPIDSPEKAVRAAIVQDYKKM